MKGIIAEIRGNHMIVIAKNGDFSRCKKIPNCDIGDEVNIPERNMKSIYKNLSAVAACFLILIMLSTGVYAYYTPYSYVSVDMNPSLELYVNRFERVIEVHAFNDEALQIIKASKGIKNQDISVALEQILGNAEEAGYLKKDAGNSLMIVVSSKNTKEEAILIDKMSKTSTKSLSNLSNDYEVIMENTKVENYKKAKEQNISPGKVMLANRFKQANPEIDEEKVKNMPLRQAIKQIEKEEVKEVEPSKAIKPAAELPKEKPNPKSKVMNIKQLIREKNEELSDKLDKESNKDSNKEKNDHKNTPKDNEEINNSKDNDKDNDENNSKNNDDVKDKAKDEANNDEENRSNSKNNDKKDDNNDNKSKSKDKDKN